MHRPSPELIEATLSKSVLWFVIFTKPQAERLVVEQLEEKGIDSFVPLTRPPPRFRRMPTPKPVFARYVFATRPLWNLRGEICVLGADNPLTVPGRVMLELFARIDAHGHMQAPGFRLGDAVRVKRDPFMGLLGQISRLGGREAQIWVAQIGATLRLPLEAIEAA